MAKASERGVWYFAHPYSVIDDLGRYVLEAEAANFQLCCIRASVLLRHGFNVYAPICHSHPINMACPEFLARHEHFAWYTLDNEMIAATEWRGIILAPGWEQSKGCCAERAQFEARGLSVMLYDEAISIVEAPHGAEVSGS